MGGGKHKVKKLQNLCSKNKGTFNTEVHKLQWEMPTNIQPKSDIYLFIVNSLCIFGIYIYILYIFLRGGGVD